MINKINGKILIRSLITILFFMFVLNIVHEQNSLLYAEYNKSVAFSIVPGTLETIEENITPVSELNNGFAISSVALIIGSLMMMISIYFTKQKSGELEDEDKRFVRKIWPGYLAPIPVIAGIILFFCTEKISLNTVMYDKWTPAFIMLAMIELYIANVNLQKIKIFQ